MKKIICLLVGHKGESTCNAIVRYLDEQWEAEQKKDGCPPHNLVDHAYTGAWASTNPPPTKICTKCLITI